jgi:hypothetical protein
MLYVDYHFEINQAGLLFSDKHEDERIKIENTPFKVGDSFTLQLDDLNRLFFRKDNGQAPPVEQLNFDF